MVAKIMEEIKFYYDKNKPMDSVLHNKLLDLYRIYLCIRGLPVFLVCPSTFMI